MTRSRTTRGASPARGAPRTPAPLRHPATGELRHAFDRLVALARELPGVEESRSYGTPALKVNGKFMARLRTEAEGGLAIHCDLIDRHMLMQADPETFYITEHYRAYPMVLIDLTRVRWDAMPHLLEQAWRQAAPARLRKQYDMTRPETPAPTG